MKKGGALKVQLINSHRQYVCSLVLFSDTFVKMPRNVEIKARIRDFDRLLNLAKQLSNSSGTLIEQEDTFFNAPNGRLKLRELKVMRV